MVALARRTRSEFSGTALIGTTCLGPQIRVGHHAAFGRTARRARTELFDLDGEYPRFDVPLKRVKKRRVIQQPLSDLAVEIIREAALRGTKVKSLKTRGICALLGLKSFTPHDLRRTAATLAGDLGFDDAWIAKCLDHAASRKQEQIVPSVTGKVYDHSKRMKEKRAVLDGVAAELRRIIGGTTKRSQCVLPLGPPS